MINIFYYLNLTQPNPFSSLLQGGSGGAGRGAADRLRPLQLQRRGRAKAVWRGQRQAEAAATSTTALCQETRETRHSCGSGEEG